MKIPIISQLFLACRFFWSLPIGQFHLRHQHPSSLCDATQLQQPLQVLFIYIARMVQVKMPPARAELTSSFSITDTANEVVCPLPNQDGSNCRKRCIGVSSFILITWYSHIPWPAFHYHNYNIVSVLFFTINFPSLLAAFYRRDVAALQPLLSRIGRNAITI